MSKLQTDRLKMEWFTITLDYYYIDQPSDV